MSIFAISFRIGKQGDYDTRWASVVERCRAEAQGNSTWEETTSFFLLESAKSAQTLCNDIYIKSDFMEDWDKMVVINLSFKDHAIKGNFNYPHTLNGFLNNR